MDSHDSSSFPHPRLTEPELYEELALRRLDQKKEQSFWPLVDSTKKRLEKRMPTTIETLGNSLVETARSELSDPASQLIETIVDISRSDTMTVLDIMTDAATDAIQYSMSQKLNSKIYLPSGSFWADLSLK